MARSRDVVVAVIIVACFVVVIGFFGLAMIGFLSTNDGAAFGTFGGGAVGIVEVYGQITESSGRQVVDDLERWYENNSIKAVVVHVNSPGGEVGISQEIYGAILRMRDYKPVVVSMAGVAASGGYYIACAADRVMANPGTVTGSIGTILSFHTFEGAMEKLGIGLETVKSGELKDVGDYSRKMTEKERLMLSSVVMDGYEQFVEVVAEGRGMDKEEVYPLADGSIFTGSQAYNLGLVDTLGGLGEAVDMAAELAGMEPEPKVVRPYRREKFTVFDLLSGALGDLGQKIEATSSGPRLLYLYE